MKVLWIASVSFFVVVVCFLALEVDLLGYLKFSCEEKGEQHTEQITGRTAQVNVSKLWELKMKRNAEFLAVRSKAVERWRQKKGVGERVVYDLFEPDFDCITKTRVGSTFFGDGPKFMCDVEVMPGKDCLVYSVGSNGDFSFEKAIHRRFGCETHTLDPTDWTGRWAKMAATAHTQFHDVGLGAARGYMKTARKARCEVDTLGNVMRRLGHQGRRLDVLKIDCEGCEYAVFQGVWKDVAEGRLAIGQVLVEVHGNDFDRAAAFFEGATEAGYLVYSKERNQWGCNGEYPR